MASISVSSQDSFRPPRVCSAFLTLFGDNCVVPFGDVFSPRKPVMLDSKRESGEREDDDDAESTDEEEANGKIVGRIEPRLYFPMLHVVGSGTCLATWGACLFLLKANLVLSPWLIPAIISSGIACKGFASTFSELATLQQLENRSFTLASLMYACCTLIPVPFIIMYPGIALPVRIAIPGAVGACAIFEVWYPSILGVNEKYAKKSLTLADSEANVEWNALPSGAVRFVKRYFQNSDGKGATFAFCCLGATVFSLGLDFVANQWRGLFFDAIQQKQSLKFGRLLRDFLFIGFASIVGGSYGSYITSMWDLHWRQFMTEDLLSAWFQRHAYFKLSTDVIDNCDQRICEDVKGFVALTRGLGLGSLESIGRLAIFLPQLMISAPPGLWELCLFASVFSSLVTHAIGKELIPNNVAIQASEANFRSSLIRVREEGEPIALMGSEERENANCMVRFEELKASLWSAMQVSFRLGSFTSGYSLCQTVFPFILLSPFYFSGQITMGTMFLLEGVMGNVQQGLDFFIVSYGDLTLWRATTDRLLHLENSASKILQPQLPEVSNRLKVTFPQLVIGTKILLSNLKIDIGPGDRVLLTGAEGKSMIMKALALIHPCEGEWEARPRTEDITFMPQRSILPQEPMTLRELLAFPDEEPVIEPEYALNAVGLKSCLENLDNVNRWTSMLSANETQRLAFARLLCKPLLKRWLFMDDPVSHFSGPEATHVFQALNRRLGPHHTVITIARQSGALRRFHERHLEIIDGTLIEKKLKKKWNRN